MRPPETQYRGERLMGPGCTAVGVRVTVDGRPLTLPPSLRDVAHRSGYEWGYLGSGPATLALALLYDATGDRDLAVRWYQWLMRAVVYCWCDHTWRVTAGQLRDLVRSWEKHPPAEALVVLQPEGGGS